MEEEMEVVPCWKYLSKLFMELIFERSMLVVNRQTTNCKS